MFERSKKAASFFKRLTAVAAVPVLSLLALTLMVDPADSTANALYIVSNEAYVDLTEQNADIFLTDASAELVDRSSGSDLLLEAGQQVSITYQDSTRSTVSQAETVSQLLSRLSISPSPLEMVAVAFEDEAVEITIGSEFVFYEHVTSVKEHEVIYKYNASKPQWSETVLQQGQDGSYSEVYEIIYQDGVETARQLIDIIETEPTPAIIERGGIENFAQHTDAVASIQTNADGSGTLTLENGQVLTFSSARKMEGTAYTAGVGVVGTTTATGTKVREGVVAVDKRVLPLGTKVYVVSNDGAYVYGFAIAEDTGVRGNAIDLYMDTYRECIQFGRRGCTVYILD